MLSDDDLASELLLMTDAFTDELFMLSETAVITFPISRLLVDVERFPDDDKEPMSNVGMGMIYTHTAFGNRLKRVLNPDEKKYMRSRYYDPHHLALTIAVENEIQMCGSALIVDCHSFPSQPLPCDQDQSIPRPEFCIGKDSFHTPTRLSQKIIENLQKKGFIVEVNRPYEGTMVPQAFYKNEPRVMSIMIEINRSLYMDEKTGAKTNGFDAAKRRIENILLSIKQFQEQDSR